MVFCLGGAGYLAMLSADGRERIRVWGRLVSLWRRRGTAGPAAVVGNAGGCRRERAPDSPHRPRAREQGHGADTRALAAAGRRVGLASIVLALCAPLLVPGLHPSKLFSSGPGIGGTGGGAGDSLALPSALAQTVNQLHESQPRTVFTYTTNATRPLQASRRPNTSGSTCSTPWPTPAGRSTNYASGARPVTSLPGPQGLTDATSDPSSSTPQLPSAGTSPARGPQPVFLPVPYPPTRSPCPGSGSPIRTSWCTPPAARSPAGSTPWPAWPWTRARPSCQTVPALVRSAEPRPEV